MIVFKGWLILDTEERGEFRSDDVIALSPEDGRYGVLFRILSPIINESTFLYSNIFIHLGFLP